MSFPYQFHEKAHEDYINAYEWYESKQSGLGDKFMEKVEMKLSQIREHPEFYGRKQNTHFRESKIKDFPYNIVFEFFPRKGIIHIAAIHHEKKSLRQKYRRMK